METENGIDTPLRPSPGARLRELREARGLTLEAASEATHVKARYLDALEREDVESLLAAAYAKSFLKAYARLLEADETLIDQYRDLIHDRWLTESPPGEREPAGGGGGRLILLGAFGVAAIVTVILVLSSGALDGKTVSDELTSGTTIPLVSDTVAFDSVSQHLTQPVIPAQLTLEVVAVETTWVEIITDGKTRRSETLNPGEIRLLDADHGFTVTLGNGAGVELRLNGRRLPALGPRGAVVREAIITQESLEEMP